VSRDDVEQAARLLRGHVRRTPVAVVEAGTLAVGPVVLKLELLQHTGSFKPRGAFTHVLRSGSPPLLVAASGGNHALAVAYVASRLGLRAELFVPETAPVVKVQGIRALGGHVTLVGRSYAEALAASEGRAQQAGGLVVHAYDAPHVVAGQGTVGLELEQQAPEVDTVLVACGGGGLVGGIAAAVGATTRVGSVEPRGAAAMHAALQAGRPVDVPVDSVAADSLGARRAGEVPFAVCRAAGVLPVLVDDQDVVRARALLWSSLRVAAEPGSAAALAALLSGAYAPGRGERVAVVVCGGNADPAPLAPE